jgi:hypothetical protein
LRDDDNDGRFTYVYPTTVSTSFTSTEPPTYFVGGSPVLNIPFIVETKFDLQGKKQVTGIYKMSMTRNTITDRFSIDTGSMKSLYPVEIQFDVAK